MNDHMPYRRPGALQCVWVPTADGTLEAHWVADTPEAEAEVLELAEERIACVVTLERLANAGRAG